MADGTISEVSEAIGQLRAVVSALGNQIGVLSQQWMQQDRAATEGRARLYDRIGELSLQVNTLAVTVQTMKPLVDAGEAARLRSSGVRYILRGMWVLFIALVSGFTAAAVNWFQRAPPPHH